jgi:hypothetical protein
MRSILLILATLALLGGGYFVYSWFQPPSRTNTAASERARLVTEVSSRAQQFQDLLPKYRENPGLFVQQRLTEVLGRVFNNAQDKIFLAESTDGKRKELRLLLNREPLKKPEETKP